MSKHRSSVRKRKTKSPSKRPSQPRSKILASARARIQITARDRLAGKWFAKLVALQARLRGPHGCPWDREQTHESLRKFLVEETYEVLDAMESDDSQKFSSELGDLLLQVTFHSKLAEEAGRFAISDVIESVHTKMVRRHPHVFGNGKSSTSADVLKKWEQLKAEERAKERQASGGKTSAEITGAAAESVLGGIPRSLPAVLEAYQLTRRASHIGFDWTNLAGILAKLEEEKQELQSALAHKNARTVVKSGGASAKRAAAHLEEEVGDLLFVGVNIARFLGVDPEIALKKANRKFRERFSSMEAEATGEGSRLADLPRERMEELWNQAKGRR